MGTAFKRVKASDIIDHEFRLPRLKLNRINEASQEKGV
tara:strand:- start:689 stop:802 length:114 start_codon:yes stop_codon:yes gene_type:complete